jgi:hypothetical protein
VLPPVADRAVDEFMLGEELRAYVLLPPTAGVARPPLGSGELFALRELFEAAPVFAPPRAEYEFDVAPRPAL